MDKQKFIENFESAIDGLEPESLNMDTNFKELDEWDSMEALSIIAMIDAEYGVQLSAEELRNSRTLQDLYIIINSKQK